MRAVLNEVKQMTAEEEEQLKSLRAKENNERRVQEEAATDARLKGYMYWCSEGCGFVSRNHRCEQWSSVTYVSPALQAALMVKK